MPSKRLATLLPQVLMVLHMHYAHLRYLGHCGIRSLTSIFNLSISSNTIPNLWKQASIIPLLKPGKSPTVAWSYRPISLLCTPSKILERLVLNRITPFLPFSPSQHGFRSLHSNTTLLTSLSQSILEGLNHGKPAPRSLLLPLICPKPSTLSLGTAWYPNSWVRPYRRTIRNG